jgi:hypothetical protein
VVDENDPIHGAVIAMQTFGDFLAFNPHCHVLVKDGCSMAKHNPLLEVVIITSIPNRKPLL